MSNFAIGFVFMVGLLTCAGGIALLFMYLYERLVNKIVDAFIGTRYIIRYAADYEGRQEAKRQVNNITTVTAYEKVKDD